MVVRRAKKDQPGHSPSLISLRCALTWVPKEPSLYHADSEDCSDWVDAQADLSLRWMHMPFCWFCHEAAQMFIALFAMNISALSSIMHMQAIKTSMSPVFAVRKKRAWVLSYPMSASEDSDQTRRMSRLFWVFAGAHSHFVGFVMRRLMCCFYCCCICIMHVVCYGNVEFSWPLNGKMRIAGILRERF